MLNYGYRNNYYFLLWDNHWRSYRIDSETAVQIALNQVPGQVVKVELDYEDDLLVYEVYIRTAYGLYEVKIDANTGRVIKVEREDD